MTKYGLWKRCRTQGAVALHAAVGGAAQHGADHAAAHQDHAHVTSVRLLDVLLEEVGCVVTDQVAQICQVVLVPRQEHGLAWRRVRRRAQACLLLFCHFAWRLLRPQTC